jgi:RNA-binding protein
MSTYRVGTVAHVCQRLAIVPIDGAQMPEIGTVVVDQELQRVGRIVDIFGPVSAPYAAVSPTDQQTGVRLIGQRVYAR